MNPIKKIRNWLDGHGDRPALKIIGPASRLEARRTFSEARRRVAFGGSIGALAAAVLAENSRDASAQRYQTAPQPFAIVTSFGADPTGVLDSTAAFLAAEASFPAGYSGVVFMPPGKYKISNPGIQFVRAGTCLMGSGCGRNENPSGNYGSVIDGTSLTNAGGNITSTYAVRGVGNNGGSFYSDFAVLLPLHANFTSIQPPGFNIVSGLSVGDAAHDCVVRDVIVHQGDEGFFFKDAIQCSISDSVSSAAAMSGLTVCGSTTGFESRGALCQNAGLIGIWMVGTVNGAVPTSCHIYGIMDEGASSGLSGGNVWAADAVDCGYHNAEIYTNDNAITVHVGGGTLSGAVRFCLDNVWIGPYATDVRSPTATIYMHSNATDTVIRDVITNPQTGTDIVDHGQNTVYRNVNRQTSIPRTPAQVTATITGTTAAADTVALTFTNTNAIGFPITKTYTVAGGDTTTTIATGLKALINADTTLAAAGLTASSSTNVVTVTQPQPIGGGTTVSSATGHGGGGTEAAVLSPLGGVMVSIAPVAANFAGMPSGIPGGLIFNPVDGGLYYLDASGVVQHVAHA